MVGLWKFVWKLNYPNKIKHFMWRACKNILPTNHLLTTRKVTSEDGCMLCEDYESQGISCRIVNLQKKHGKPQVFPSLTLCTPKKNLSISYRNSGKTAGNWTGISSPPLLGGCGIIGTFLSTREGAKSESHREGGIQIHEGIPPRYPPSQKTAQVQTLSSPPNQG